jgi:hypothetical protein
MWAGHVNVKPVRARFGGSFREMSRNFRLMLTHPGSQLGKVFLRQFFDRTFDLFHRAHIPKLNERGQCCKCAPI